jgi:hypothetical protein
MHEKACEEILGALMRQNSSGNCQFNPVENQYQEQLS